MSEYVVKTFAERSDRIEENWRILDEGWLDFMQNDPVGNLYFGRLYQHFPDYQFMLYDGETVVATCNSIPVTWNLDDQTLPDEGWDWALEHGYALLESATPATTLSALGITIAREYLGKGVSSQALRAMKNIAVQRGLNALIAPVRPTLKSSYPLTPMERYITWTQDEGAPFDPWLRTHWRAGARIVKVAPRSMIIPGTVAQWQAWTGMKFPESGAYVVPGALNPVTADVEHDLITYVEPNVWMHHPIDNTL
ncbi:MAG: GNAT family N-acetyltransferase [Chloroflexota bacterium]